MFRIPYQKYYAKRQSAPTPTRPQQAFHPAASHPAHTSHVKKAELRNTITLLDLLVLPVFKRPPAVASSFSLSPNRALSKRPPAKKARQHRPHTVR